MSERILSSQNSQKLAEAVRILYEQLQESKQQLDARGSEDGGRAAAISGLKAVLDFLYAIDGETAKYSDALLRLWMELYSVHHGTPSSMFSVKRIGSPPASLFYRQLKGEAVFTVRRL